VPNVAHRLLLTGEVFEAQTALAGGLVDLVVPATDVDACLAAQAEALGKGAPLALAETKRLLRAARTGPLAEQFPDLLDLSARFFASEEGQEGIAAFREKRPARWVPA
jgi:methylglutaconyl-CoA hydratase